MPRITVVLRADVAGIPLPGFPRTLECEVQEALPFDVEQADRGADSAYVSLPWEELEQGAQVVAIVPDRDVNVRLAGTRDSCIPVRANGVLLLLSGKLCVPQVKGAKVQRAATGDAGDIGGVRLRGVIGGR